MSILPLLTHTHTQSWIVETLNVMMPIFGIYLEFFIMVFKKKSDYLKYIFIHINIGRKRKEKVAKIHLDEFTKIENSSHWVIFGGWGCFWPGFEQTESTVKMCLLRKMALKKQSRITATKPIYLNYALLGA